MLQGHGDDGYKHHREVRADFSSNVYYGGAPAGLRDYLFDRWEKIQHYPEVSGESLTEKIAWHYGFPTDNFMVTNGSTESIYLIAQAFKNKRTSIVVPAFAEYEDACRMHGHQLSFISWTDFGNAPLLDADLLFICNPNNPTGEAIRSLELLISRHQDIVFIIDEAFIEFTIYVSSAVAITQLYPNVIVMRSMTKAYSIPGLRLGYIVAQAPVLQRLRSIKLPWTVNTMALEAGHYIIDHFSAVQVPLEQLLLDKVNFIEGLSDGPLVVKPGHTHFFLAETRVGTAAGLKRFLLDHFDLLIRDASNFRGLTPAAVRIATLSPAKNQLLIQALRQWKPM